MRIFSYDIETYPNVFTFACEDVETKDKWYYEISERRNDLTELLGFLYALHDNQAKLVGFNNIGFDWPVVDYILRASVTWSGVPAQIVIDGIYNKAMSIIRCDDRFSHIVWEPLIPQIDLFKIHHFDNRAKSTPLKVLEFNMRSEVIEDLPFEPGTYLTLEQLPVLAKYNIRDVTETTKFYHHTKGLIAFRDKLTAQYGRDFTNYNDIKIGTDYMLTRIEEAAPGTCWTRDEHGRRAPRQTTYSSPLPLRDIIFSNIEFDQPEFKRISNWFKSQMIPLGDLKSFFTNVNCNVGGIQYNFGLGGIHGSVRNKKIVSTSDTAIIDIDVASYYPNIAIVNKLHPAHMGEIFCDIYKEVYKQRKTYPKSTVENGMLKLALNGVFGNSNNVFSPFFDPKYTMATTVNGQLLLCKFIEMILDISDLSVIQANTDGVTVEIPRNHISKLESAIKDWEKFTGLTFENVEYSAMFVRDVNNYIAVSIDGKVKRKGAYGYVTALEDPATQEKPWHKDFSELIVPKAAEAVLVHGKDLTAYVTSPDRNIMDFMLRTKPPRSNKVVLIQSGIECPQQRISRYYVTKEGWELVKRAPCPTKYARGQFKKSPKTLYNVYQDWHSLAGNVWNPDIHTQNKTVYGDVETRFAAGWEVTVCNNIDRAERKNINFDYYIQKAQKLIEVFN